nr:imidazole glycerol phosphate synthase cyclase subunit [uncultured Methanoregula sp.]
MNILFNVRVIPRLDIKGPNLVKGIHLEGLRVLGKPEQFARYYYETGADELIYIDVVASLYGRNSILDMIKKTSQEIFIPLTVGGGLRTIGDIQNALRAGADKVALNTAAIRDPALLREASKKFGSSTIVVSIAAKKKEAGVYEAFTDNGRERTGINVIEWAKKAEELGAGEIYLMSIDRDGTGLGYDIGLIKSVAKAVSIPVIAAGGAGKLDHLSEVINDGCADAISMASILHYAFIETNYLDADYSSEGNIEFLKNIKKFTKVNGATITDIKNHLLTKGISCRPVEDRT